MISLTATLIRQYRTLILSLGALLCLSLGSLATASPLQKLQQRWAEVNYQLQGDSQLAGFEQLLSDANATLAEQSQSAPLLIWRGIIQSTYAGAKGGLAALKIAKAAKRDLEQALAIDRRALDGSAQTSLGTLYANVPGWPIGFGSDKKALQLLEEALAINPAGIDSNYFYAEFMRAQGEPELAKQHYLRALEAAPREGRELADQGRRREIQRALNALK